MEEDGEIRQTDLAIAGGPREVRLSWSSNKLDAEPVTATVDKMNRVYLPIQLFGNGTKRQLKGVSLDDGKTIKRVTSIEPRYQGNTVTHMCCTLEG